VGLGESALRRVIMSMPDSIKERGDEYASLVKSMEAFEE
jgi:hypothetical protein